MQAPVATGFGFGKSILVGGLCMRPAAKTMDLGGHALPSLGAYQLLFAICAGAAILAAALAVFIPTHSATADAALPDV